MTTHEKVRCEPCCGMGYKGRWRIQARGRVWKIETCRYSINDDERTLEA